MSMTMSTSVTPVTVVSPFSENNFVVRNFFDGIEINILFCTVIRSMVMTMTVSMSMTISTVMMGFVVMVTAMVVAHSRANRVTDCMVTEIDQIVGAMIASHRTRLRPVTVMFESTGSNSFFEPFTVGETTLSSESFLWVM